jgi:hypothetical protein
MASNLSTEPSPRRSAEDALPPVQPPSAGFIVQLFVVPAVIVTIIVLVWVLFNWLAQMGSEPREYLQQIEQDNANSWFAAHKLADQLRTDEALKSNRQVAQDLARMLQGQIDDGEMGEDKVRLRIFLCKALGEFHVTDGLAALLRAAETQRQSAEADVRRSAIEALALLASNAGPSAQAAAEGQMLPTLLSASRDESAQIREPAAFALGTLHADQATARLVELLGDTHANTRYNAATGLARRGNSASLEVLVEMLDVAGLKLEAAESQDLTEVEAAQALDFKRALVSVNGMRAAGQLAKANPQADLSSLRTAVKELLSSDLQSLFVDAKYAAEVRVHAEELQSQLSR